jgi:hypothetical protein
MRFARLSEGWLIRVVLCSLALALGIATARFTDIARRDLTREPSGASVHEVEPTPAQSLRASVRYTGKPSSSARASRLLRAP